MDVGIANKKVCCIKMPHKLNFKIFDMRVKSGNFVLIN